MLRYDVFVKSGLSGIATLALRTFVRLLTLYITMAHNVAGIFLLLGESLLAMLTSKGQIIAVDVLMATQIGVVLTFAITDWALKSRRMSVHVQLK